MPPEHKRELIAEAARIRKAIEREVCARFVALGVARIPITPENVATIESAVREVLEREVPDIEDVVITGTVSV